MLKSNITNLQFILDNKPQYSISFDKTTGKKQVPASRYQQQQENNAPWRHQDVSRRLANQLTIIKMQ